MSPLWLTLATTLITQFENCKRTAYPDPGTGGEPWTIGWGSTGPSITRGVTWTQTQADADLDHRVTALGAVVDHALTTPASDYEKAALISLAYNIGATNFATSTLVKLFNAGDVAGAAAQFERWDHAGGKEMAGLLRRRLIEEQEFLTNATGVNS